jgi:hypothetical protein
VDRTFARQGGGYGALCHLGNGLAVSVGVPEPLPEGARIAVRREGEQWRFVGRQERAA